MQEPDGDRRLRPPLPAAHRLALALLLVALAAIAGGGYAHGLGDAGTGPSITVTPTEGLVNGQVVMVSGQGFAFPDGVHISECGPSGTVCKFLTDAFTTAGGVFGPVEVHVARTFSGVTCGSSAPACEIVVTDGSQQTATQPVAFGTGPSTTSTTLPSSSTTSAPTTTTGPRPSTTTTLPSTTASTVPTTSTTASPATSTTTGGVPVPGSTTTTAAGAGTATTGTTGSRGTSTTVDTAGSALVRTGSAIGYLASAALCLLALGALVIDVGEARHRR